MVNDKLSNNGRKEISCETLRKLYINDQKSDTEIGKIFGVSRNSIMRRRQDCDITSLKIRTSKQKIMLDKEKLHRLYIEQKKNEKEIAKIMNCDFRIVKRNLEEYGVEIRKPIHSYDKISQEKLYKMYVMEGHSAESIGKEYNYSGGGIKKLLKRYGMKSKLEEMRERVEEADLHDMYVVKNMEASTISKNLQCSNYVIYDRLEKLGIPTHEDHSKERGEYLKWCRKEGEKRKREMREILGGKCFICKRENIQLQIHHMCYKPNDIINDNYKKNRAKYYIDLYPLVLKEKWRFLLLCSTCHYSIGKLNDHPPKILSAILETIEEMDEQRNIHKTKYEDLE